MQRIYLSPPDVGARERELLINAFDSNWIAPLGPEVDHFESALADYIGLPHAVALSSGTAGLHLALKVLGVKPGDEVLLPSLTFIATAAAATYLDARPVFIDSCSETWNLDPVLLEAELEDLASRDRLPAAVVAVDLYGQCASYEEIIPTCQRFGVPLIEDAAEALGALYAGKPAGQFGTVSVFSFNGNKIITTSGGGALLASEGQLADRVRYLATQARDPLPYYEHREVGYNYRLSNLLAAIGRGQLENLEHRVARRRAINAYYQQALSSVPGIQFMPIDPSGVPNCWLTCILIDPRKFGATNEDVRVRLERALIEARPTWKPLHLQPAFAGCRRRGGAVAEQIFERGLCLPSGSALTDSELDRIVDSLLSCHTPSATSTASPDVNAPVSA